METLQNSTDVNVNENLTNLNNAEDNEQQTAKPNEGKGFLPVPNGNGNNGQAADKQEEKKKRSSNKRKLATDKNILVKKRKKLDNLEEKLKGLKAIRKRGYERKETADGRIKCNFLTKEEITWYGIKIDNMEQDIIDLEKEIKELTESFSTRVNNTKTLAKEKLKAARHERRAKAKAKSLVKEVEKTILASTKNGKAEKALQIKEYKEDNKIDEALKSMMEFFEEEMKPAQKEISKDVLIKDEFLHGVLKLICTV